MSEDSSYEAAVTRAADADLPDAIRLLPYARHVYTAYHWIHDRRFRAFLNVLNRSFDGPTREERERFEVYINSERGGEMLADFAEQAVRTRSRTALASLAVLYSRTDMDTDRKAQAALSLDGISERSIDAFLLLWECRATLQGTDIASPHDLRHTFGHRFLVKGGDIYPRSSDTPVSR